MRIYHGPQADAGKSAVHFIDLRTGMTGGSADPAARLLAAAPLPAEFADG